MFSFNNIRFTALVVTALAGTTAVQAQTYDFSFAGGGLSASGSFTVAPTTTAGTYQIQTIGGTFADTNFGISGAITGLVYSPLPATPPPFNSPGVQAPWASFDNLFYPGSDAPIVCAGYPVPGGAVDTYGMLFTVAGGYTAELWSDGDFGAGPVYNAADAKGTSFLSYPDPNDGIGVPVGFQFNAVPEPSSFAYLGVGALGLLVFRRKRA